LTLMEMEHLTAWNHIPLLQSRRLLPLQDQEVLLEILTQDLDGRKVRLPWRV
jgi:hypothetical protein